MAPAGVGVNYYEAKIYPRASARVCALPNTPTRGAMSDRTGGRGAGGGGDLNNNIGYYWTFVRSLQIVNRELGGIGPFPWLRGQCYIRLLIGSNM